MIKTRVQITFILQDKKRPAMIAGLTSLNKFRIKLSVQNSFVGLLFVSQDFLPMNTTSLSIFA